MGMNEALLGIMNDGPNTQAVITLLSSALLFYLAFELRRFVRTFAAYRRVRSAVRLAKGIVLQVDGNQATSRWEIEEIGFKGCWLRNVNNPALEAWWPHRKLLDDSNVFVRYEELPDVA